jgi:hypothetical protein
MLQIAVINESTAISDADVQNMLPAFDQQWNQDLLPVWGVDTATFTFVPQGQAPASGTWWVVFLDDSDQAGALAYHDLTDEGLPISKVFVKTIQGDNASVSVGATHEICEMAVDPWLNSAYQDPQGVFWAGEIAASRPRPGNFCAPGNIRALGNIGVSASPGPLRQRDRCARKRSALAPRGARKLLVHPG